MSNTPTGFIQRLVAHIRLLTKGYREASYEGKFKDEITVVCTYHDVDPHHTRIWELLKMGKGSTEINLDLLIDLQRIQAITPSSTRRRELYGFMDSLGDLPERNKQSLRHSSENRDFEDWINGD